MESPILGIDLGTSNTVAAAYVGGKPVIIPNAVGDASTPSVVAFEESSGEVLIGAAARRQAVLNPRGTIFSVKRLLGMTFEQVKSQGLCLPYEVVPGADGDAHIRVGGRTLAPEEIAAFLFVQLQEEAKAFLQEEVTRAVVTVPAYFNNRQRRATRAAAEMAGLEVARIVNEPTAAALAYGLSRPGERYRVAVVHLGGGTLDVSILDVAGEIFGVEATCVFSVMAVCGDTCLGGDDFDRVIMDWAAEELRRQYRVEAASDSSLMAMVKWEAEKAKCELSTRATSELVIPYVRTGTFNDFTTVSLPLPRTVFEDRARPLLERIAGPCRQALADMNHHFLRSGPVDHVILVGQQTRMPAVQRAVAEVFGKQPRHNFDPAGIVARGAAIQGAVLAGECRSTLLIDVIPVSLGIATSEGKFTPLVPRNTTIPTERKEVFSTTLDNQTEIAVEVFQGEHPMAADNLLVGTFTLRGLPPARRGVPQIEIAFAIDQNGVLLVSAKDLQTGREESLSIEGVYAEIALRGAASRWEGERAAASSYGQPAAADDEGPGPPRPMEAGESSSQTAAGVESWPPEFGVACPYLILFAMGLLLALVGVIDVAFVAVGIIIGMFAGYISRFVDFRTPSAIPGFYHEATFSTRFMEHSVGIVIALVLLGGYALLVGI